MPPRVVATEPDTFSVVPGFHRPVVIRFNERISERAAGGGLEDAVVVSPRTGAVRVQHGRASLEVELAGGFRDGLVYRVTLLPRIQDMFGNALAEPFELVFSTGAQVSPAALAGYVAERVTGRAAADVTVDAAASAGGTVYTARSDTAGIFALRFLPPGDYRVAAYQDRNRNGELDAFEARDTALARIGPTDTVLVALALLEADSTPAVLARLEISDSVTLRLLFDDYIAPDDSLRDVTVRLAALDGGSAPQVREILHAHRFEAMRRARAATRARADTSAPAALDTTPRPAAESERPQPGRAAPRREEAGPAVQQAADTAGGGKAAAPLPAREIVALLDSALRVGATYQVEISGLRNLNGVPGGGGRAAVEVPRPARADSVAAPRDSARVAPDARKPPDTATLPPRAMGARLDAVKLPRASVAPRRYAAEPARKRDSRLP